ncbi:MAG: hypothetical protein ASARMPREDX12_001871 [Alectoria sarmentosa]|nr:MAG: hypothetical protein ASARMPREDX12_001871 [Alectoria sarmentosa]
MAASAENEPKRHLRLLKDVRYLYGQYLKFFLPVPTSCAKLAQTLSSLNNGIYRFDSKYSTGNEPLSVFCQLTLGLSDTLIALRRGLISCARDYESDTLDNASDWQVDLETASMERLQTRLNPMSMGVEIINEAVEMALNGSFEARSSEKIEEIYKRIDEAENSSARLQELVNSFLYGITVQTKLKTTDGRVLHTFTSANVSHREVGQNIAARLGQKSQEAVNSKHEDEGPMAWKIRHSIYWLSKSSEDLTDWRSENELALSYHTVPVSDEAWHTIARIFLDALKAAWLLGDLGDLRAYEPAGFGIQEVVACAKKKVLDLLQSFYTDIFTVPNYDLINELGDFSICTDDEREQIPSQLSDSCSITSSHVSEPEIICRESTNPTFPVELEASSSISLTESHPHHVPSELGATTSTRRESNLFLLNAGVVNTTGVSTIADGLHITDLENPFADQESIDHISARLHENELSNAEIDSQHTVWTGFQYNVFSIETSPPHDSAFIRTRVRIFRLDSQVSSYLRLITYREALPTDQSVIQPSTTALVPVYAFATDPSESSELYISDSGLQPSLRYKFHCQDSNGDHHPWELYGFQGALMGAYFEADYSPVSVSLHRCGSQTTESERFPRIQVWTDFPNAHPTTHDSSSPASLSPTLPLSSPISAITSKAFSALTSRLTTNINNSKLFIFSRNYIYVLFGSFADLPLASLGQSEFTITCVADPSIALRSLRPCHPDPPQTRRYPTARTPPEDTRALHTQQTQRCLGDPRMYAERDSEDARWDTVGSSGDRIWRPGTSGRRVRGFPEYRL